MNKKSTMKKLAYTLAIILLPFFGMTQTQYTQNLKGQVLDQDTGLPLIGANIVLPETDPLLGTTTDIDGYYTFENLPIGRYNLSASYIGYLDQAKKSVLLTSGKETVINFQLRESVVTGEVVTVTAIREGDVSTNKLATISIQKIDSEQASRFSGTRNDVSRMASGFAGVVANNDSRNDIVIRGNSPSGLLWRLDGMDIPNPSHFGAIGATGGPVSILNNNTLANSNFLTGAFPATYGNALSGVFDLKFRNGNKDKIEGTGQVGFNGFEFGLEGPISKKNKSSFLINYRYSAVALFSQIFGSDSSGGGGGTGTGDAIPFYQDLSFKFNMPTKKLGTFALLGVGGFSEISFLSDLGDSTNANLFSDSRQNLNFKTNMGFIALTNQHYYDNQSSGKISLSTSTSGVATSLDEIDDDLIAVPVFRDMSNIGRTRISYDYKRKINTRHSIYAGINTQQIALNFQDSVKINPSDETWESLRDFEGGTFLSQVYAQWQFRYSDKLIFNTGLFSQSFSLNNTYSIEPRVNLRYSISPKLNFNFGLGRHSRIQNLQLYLTQTQIGNETVETNRELEMTRSNHAVIGLEYQFSKDWKTKAEAYVQGISNVPVELQSSSYSALNDGADFAIPSRDSLVNDGTGTNYGLELTLERSFDKGFYLLSTFSLFSSTYEGSDDITRSTAFNNRYVANVLLGKEFKLGTRLNLGLDARITAAGGRVYTPIDLERSILRDEEVRIETLAFEERLPNYFRTDIKLYIRWNGKKTTQSWSLDLQNVFDSQNVFTRSYDRFRKDVVDTFQLGRFPVVDYKITF